MRQKAARRVEGETDKQVTPMVTPYGLRTRVAPTKKQARDLCYYVLHTTTTQVMYILCAGAWVDRGTPEEVIIEPPRGLFPPVIPH